MLERINHRVRSGRSLGAGADSPSAGGGACSVSGGTYEFDMMEVVHRDSQTRQQGQQQQQQQQQQRKKNGRGGGRRGLFGIIRPSSKKNTTGNINEDGESSDGAIVQSSRPAHHHRHHQHQHHHDRTHAMREVGGDHDEDNDDDDDYFTDIPLLGSGRTEPEDLLDRSDRSFSFRTTSASSSSSAGLSSILPNRAVGLSIIIGLLGIISSTLFLGFGIGNAVDDQEQLFAMRALDLTMEFTRTWDEYMVGALWVHQACAFRNVSRTEFSRVYTYLKSHVDVAAVQWVPKILDQDRQALEEESLQFYQTYYPGVVDYRGIQGITIVDEHYNNDDDTISEASWTLEYRPTQDYYYPVHFIEPIDEMNSLSIEIDALTSSLHREALELALETFQPAATEAYRRLGSPQGGWTEDTYIKLLHPGIPLPDDIEFPDLQPKDLAALAIRIKTVVETATSYLPVSLSFYIYDTTIPDQEPTFLIAAEVYSSEEPPPEDGTGNDHDHDDGDGDGDGASERIKYLDEMSLAELIDETVFFLHITNIQVASRTWTIATVALEDTFIPDLRYIILAGKFILVASLCVSLWMLTSYRRTKTILEVKRKADMEKTAVIVRSIRDKARAEQELNDYIAHEVRNPLAAAMSACTFVKSGINEQNPLSDPKTLADIREDVEIIDSSLTFTHDLLRSMLDMHRAANRALATDETPLDILHDVLQPVLAMLYKRDLSFEVIAECPKDLYVLSDRLRLKQILLNLCRNAARYVQKGFIKFGACVVDDKIQFFVEDSGFGISVERRKHLFSKFQESLEVMDQGSGVGLCLCKSMANLLEGDIWLDETYNSGIEGCPGSRFVIGLNKGPLSEKEVRDFVSFLGRQDDMPSTNEDSLSKATSNELPVAQASSSSSITVETRKSGVDFTFKQFKKDVDKPTSYLDEEPLPSHSVHRSAPLLVSEEPPQLPKDLSVLFVDDDMILRKLFMRSVRKVVDSWDIQEAASGEAALQLTDQKDFSIIFMDQYMASVEKKLLGTETVRALRSKGVRSIICGLSANDVTDGFWSAGADSFMFKPFPCKPDQLQNELHRILNAPRHPRLEELTATAPPKECSDSNNSDATRSTIPDEESNKEELSGCKLVEPQE